MYITVTFSPLFIFPYLLLEGACGKGAFRDVGLVQRDLVNLGWGSS